MPSAENYRARAADMAEKARKETHPTMRAQWETLELAYLRLAEQANKNAGTPTTPQAEPSKKEPKE